MEQNLKELKQKLEAARKLWSQPDQVVTNEQRALWGQYTVTAFANESGQLGEDLKDDPETVVGDLIADLMHYCDTRDVDFEEALRRGRNHHDEEIIEEREAKEA
jgi:hypothetical protein